MNVSRTIRSLVCVCAVAALLGGCRASDKNTLPDYEYHVGIAPYEEVLLTTDPAYLLLANKQSPLGADFVPTSLTKLDPTLTLYGKEVQLESATAAATEALMKEIRACGFTDIAVTSGYRSYAYQQSLFHTYSQREREAHPDWTEEQIRNQVLSYSAYPGTSEHQTGLCMDIISVNNVVLDESFEQNPVFPWMQEHAHCFGFILRYPKGEEDIVGYTYEPWHYRFVGVKAATEMHEKGLTLEEYLK